MLQTVRPSGLALPPGLIMPERKIAAPMGGGMQSLDGFGRLPFYGGAGGDGSLSDVVSSCVFDLDATQSGSYSGSGQTWANLCTVPADGELQTAYDWVRGVNGSGGTDDPTFNGTAGTAGAYWSLDGGDWFTNLNTTTPFIRSIHKTSGDYNFTIVMCVRFPTSGFGSFWGTAQTTGSQGVHLFVSGTSAIIQHLNGATFANTTRTVTTGVDCFFAISWNFTTPSGKSAYNARTFSSFTLNRNTTTTNSDSNLYIGRTNGANIMPNTTRIKAISVFNTMLSDGELGSVCDAYNARHGVTYA